MIKYRFIIIPLQMKPKYVLTAHRGPVTSLQAKETMLFAGSSDGTVSIHKIPEITYQQRIFGQTERGISQICVYNDSVAIAADDSIAVSDFNNKNLVKITINSPCVCIAMNQQHIFAGFTDASARLYERASGTEIAVYRGHESAVLSVQIFDSYLISGGQDGKIVFYNTHGMTLHTIRLKSPVSSLKLSPNGGVLTAYAIGEINVFKVQLNDLKQIVRGKTIKVLEDRFLHQACYFGKNIVFGGDSRIMIIDITNGSETEINIPGETFLCVDAAATRIYAGSKQGRIYVLE